MKRGWKIISVITVIILIIAIFQYYNFPSQEKTTPSSQNLNLSKQLQENDVQLLQVNSETKDNLPLLSCAGNGESISRLCLTQVADFSKEFCNDESLVYVEGMGCFRRPDFVERYLLIDHFWSLGGGGLNDENGPHVPESGNFALGVEQCNKPGRVGINHFGNRIIQTFPTGYFPPAVAENIPSTNPELCCGLGGFNAGKLKTIPQNENPNDISCCLVKKSPEFITPGDLENSIFLNENKLFSYNMNSPLYGCCENMIIDCRTPDLSSCDYNRDDQSSLQRALSDATNSGNSCY